MTDAAENLKATLSSLPESDREELANFLLQSLDQDESAQEAWDNELTKRLHEIETNRVKTVPADALFQSLRERYP
jgi:putative addiction module component (TIGR02574 family)